MLGFHYPELETALGHRFLRDDAPRAEANLDKLVAGRIRHVVINSQYLDYQIKRGRFKLALHPRLPLSQGWVRCALSPASTVRLTELNRAIRGAQRDGSLAAISRRYR